MPTSFRRILVPIDDTPLSSKALRTAFSVAERFASKVVVLYVRHENQVSNVAELRRDEAEYEFELKTVRETALQTLAAGNHTLPPDYVSSDVRTGDPLSCILEASVEHAADLVVMGTHGRTGLASALLGNVAYSVMRRCEKPVLAIRHPEREFLT